MPDYRHLMRTMTRAVFWMALAACGGGVWADDWPCFMGPTHDGVSAETNLVARWPEQGPPLMWKMDVGLSYSAPSVVKGALYLFHRIGGEEVLECLDAATSARRWQASYPTDYVDRYGYNGGPLPRPCPVLTAFPLNSERHHARCIEPVRRRCLANGESVRTTFGDLPNS